MKKLITVFALLLGVFATASARAGVPVSLRNVSYDPTRELYQQYNAAFAKHWKEKTGQAVVIHQSHGGSGSQAQAVIDGIEADVVTLALAADIDTLHNRGDLVPADWQSRLPDNSSPYTSTIVLLVRQGNPKAIKDWDDLVKPGVQVITPNPKTSGGARWSFLAAWAFARKKFGGDEGAKKFVASLYQHVPDLATGARGSTTTFVEQGIGDVLIAWENEALLTQKVFGSDKFEIVVPSLSILAEPPVAWVDKVVAKRGTRELAREYLAYLYSEEGQNIIADNFYRPRLLKVRAKHDRQFPRVNLVTVDQQFHGWKNAQRTYFEDGGIFDQIYRKGASTQVSPTFGFAEHSVILPVGLPWRANHTF